MNHRLAELTTDVDFSLEGCLLVANPHWQDERFAHSVMLIVHHAQGQAVGIALNKDFQDLPTAIWKQLLGTASPDSPTPIRLGGPQSGPVVALHDCDELAEFSAGEGIHFAAHVDHLEQLVRRQDAAVRLIVGQSQWTDGELDQQVQQGLWLPVSTSREIVFQDTPDMWHCGLRAAGNALVCGLTGARQPDNVTLN